MSKRCALIILDGWGHGKEDSSDAIHAARTPFTDSLYDTAIHAELRTDGENVGLPEGQMGNSEVGHMNIGAGRIVYQDLLRINKDIQSGAFGAKSEIQDFVERSKSARVVHLMGLLSDGGVHSHQQHLHALVNLLEKETDSRYVIHAFMDGRDTDPKLGAQCLEKLEKHLEGKRGEIVSVVGRYYAMDRDQRWERIKKAYDLLVHGVGAEAGKASEGVQHAYAQGVTDEFIEPIVVGDSGETIQEGDVVLCANFRSDRCRQITRALTQEDFQGHGMVKMALDYTTMTTYDDTYVGVKTIYPKDDLVNTLGEVIAKNGKSQLRMAETEKYPHVTFFFSGGRELPFENEHRIVVNSPKVATYDLQPEMSAFEVRDKAIDFIETQQPDFICLNFANPDMVGHTGVFSAIVKACETVDSCLSDLVACLKKHDYATIVIADHGNADFAMNEDGSPNTAHSLNPVPIWILDADRAPIESGILADVAPTVLDIMAIKKPQEMTHSSLLSK